MLRLALLLALLVPACGGAQGANGAPPLPACEGCGASEAPANLNAAMHLAPPDEPGTRLVVRGTVYQPDGRTPAPNVLMYAYHTNAAGKYAKRGDEQGNARRHGYLRGWLLTDEAGRYTIHTIRPAAYPEMSEPQHIHVTFTPPGRREQWADNILFADDPLLPPPPAMREGHAPDVGVQVRPAAGGGVMAQRDFVLDADGRREIGSFVRPGAGS